MFRSSLVAAVLATSTVILAAQGQQKAPPAPSPQPSVEMRRLAVYVGTWKYQGAIEASQFGPGGKVTGTDQLELLGGSFLTRHYEETGPGGLVKGIEIIGYDRDRKTYTDMVIDSTGTSSNGTMTVAADGLHVTAKGTSVAGLFHQRCSIGVPTPTGFTVKCESSADGKTFSPVFEGRWTKG